MQTTKADLEGKRCRPCEGDVAPLTSAQVNEYLQAFPEWELSEDGRRIVRSYRAKDFAGAVAFINQVAAVAEAEGHHPDLHLTGYRNLVVENTTHALGGLSENDFILAARIDGLGPVG